MQMDKVGWAFGVLIQIELHVYVYSIVHNVYVFPHLLGLTT